VFFCFFFGRESSQRVAGLPAGTMLAAGWIFACVGVAETWDGRTPAGRAGRMHQTSAPARFQRRLLGLCGGVLWKIKTNTTGNRCNAV